MQCTHTEQPRCLASCGCGWCSNGSEPLGCAPADTSSPLGTPAWCDEWQLAPSTMCAGTGASRAWFVVLVCAVFVLLAVAVAAWCMHRTRATKRQARRFGRFRSENGEGEGDSVGDRSVFILLPSFTSATSFTDASRGASAAEVR